MGAALGASRAIQHVAGMKDSRPVKFQPAGVALPPLNDGSSPRGTAMFSVALNNSVSASCVISRSGALLNTE